MMYSNGFWGMNMIWWFLWFVMIYFFPNVGVLANLREVLLVEHQAGRFQTLVMAGDAGAVDQRALGRGGGLPIRGAHRDGRHPVNC